jgi:acetoin utilization protein AcuC
VVWDDRFLDYDFGPTHPFSERSRKSAVELLQALEFFDGEDRRLSAVPTIASDEMLARFHSPSYLARVRRSSGLSRRDLLDQGDTPSFPGCFESASRLVAGTLRGLDVVRKEPGRHVFQPGGGLHHAHADWASGFCILNDPALAIAGALEPGGMHRVAYIDVDVHHGDGVMYGFYSDGRLLDIDFHQDGRTLFPGTGDLSETGAGDGAGLKVNFPLPPGTGDSEYLEAFERIVPELVRSYRPELIILQAGVDGHAGDPLAQLQLTRSAYGDVLRSVHSLAHEVCHGRLLVTGGGGYLPQNVSRIFAQHALLLSGREVPIGELPSTWRAGFAARNSTPAPPDWISGPTPRPARGSSLAVQQVVAGLERVLGRSFPRKPFAR